MNAAPRARPSVWFDHFVVAIDDLERGIDSFEVSTGIRPVRGGEHPTLGTHNALVSLGDRQYFEILAPRPGAKLDRMVLGVEQCRRLTPLLWALATDDIQTLHRRLQAAGTGVHDVVAGSRQTISGDTLRWMMFTLNDDRFANAPFFIEWDASANHPSTSTPRGCSLASFTVSTPSADNVRKLLTHIGYEVEVRSGPKGLAIVLETPKGAVTFGP